MKLKQNLLTGVFTLTALASMATLSTLTMLLPGMALAQSEPEAARHRFTPYISGFHVDEVRRLRPGVELNFGLAGTPGGWATLHIQGATRNLTLMETEPGHYEGVYTINARDKIAARSPVTANLRVGNQVTSEVLTESLQTGVGYHPASGSAGPAPVISQFSVAQEQDLSAGNELRFFVQGSPGGKVDLSIGGMRGKFFLSEVTSGEYSGTYTIRSRDRISATSPVVANLHLGQRSISSTLRQSLLAPANHTNTTSNNDNNRIERPRRCYNCGVVEAVNLIEVHGNGNYLGTIGGGVLGALLGSQVGNGSGRTAAEIAGALGGAYAGNRIQGNSPQAKHYEVSVRLQNGGAQTLSFASAPDYRVGDKVSLINGVLKHLP